MHKTFLMISFIFILSGCQNKETPKEKQERKEHRTQEMKIIGKLFTGGSQLFKDE